MSICGNNFPCRGTATAKSLSWECGNMELRGWGERIARWLMLKPNDQEETGRRHWKVSWIRLCFASQGMILDFNRSIRGMNILSSRHHEDPRGGWFENRLKGTNMQVWEISWKQVKLSRWEVLVVWARGIKVEMAAIPDMFWKWILRFSSGLIMIY